MSSSVCDGAVVVDNTLPSSAIFSKEHDELYNTDDSDLLAMLRMEVHDDGDFGDENP
jgi:hypothetical protein